MYSQVVNTSVAILIQQSDQLMLFRAKQGKSAWCLTRMSSASVDRMSQEGQYCAGLAFTKFGKAALILVNGMSHALVDIPPVLQHMPAS